MFAAALLAGLCAAEPPKPAVESKLHGEWKGGACQGVFVFKPDGTYELTRWSPGNYRLTGTWAVRWDALPPTLVLTCKDSSSKEYVGAVWEVKVTELDGEALTLAFDSPKEGKAAIRYTRVEKPAAKPGEAEYLRVEARGKLVVGEGLHGVTLDVVDLANQPVQATVHGLPLAFGGDKELAARAKTLDGRTVVVVGHLRRAAAERIAVQPTKFIYYIEVTALKAAE